MKKILYTLLLLLPITACADDNEVYDRVSLNASAERQVDNDVVIVMLYAEEEGSDAAQLADIVNRKINKAVEKIKQHDDIKLQTSAYSTSPVYRKNKITGWRVRQNIHLQSPNMTKVSGMLGTLQQTLALQSMQFSVSDELRKQIDDALIEDALEAFDARANRVAASLGRKGYRIVTINISTSGGVRPYRSFARAAMMESVAAPSVEAGDQKLSVSVNGTIELE